MQVQAKVDEADIGNVKTGQRSTFTVDAFIDDTFNGTVKEIRLQPSISANVVTYATLIDAPNDDKKLKPGMTANIIIFSKEINNALLVSAQALKFHPDSSLSKQYEIIPDPGHKKGGAGKGKHQGKTNPRIPVGGDVVSNPTAYVWVLEGQKLIQRKIKTGLNDNTQVQVLSGLSENDLIITGANGLSATATPAAAASSPFMPKRGGRR